MKLPSLPSGMADWGVWAFHAVVALGVAAGVALAIASTLDGYPLSLDELYSLQVAEASPGFAWSRYILPDVHPPLYYIVLSAWVGVFGVGEVSARLLSLLAALASLGVFWWMGRAVLSRPALAIALLWLATHWVWLSYAQEARMYAPAILGCTWLTLAFAQLWTASQPPPPRVLAVFAVLAFLTAMLHYMAMGLACVALLLLLLRFRRRPRLWPPLCIAGGLCLFWAVGHGAWVVHGEWINNHLARGLPGWFAALALLRFFVLPENPQAWDILPRSPSMQLAWLALLSVYAVLAWGWFRRARAGTALPGQGRTVLIGQLWLLGGFLLLLVVVHEWRAILVFRSMVVLLPLLAICGGCLVEFSGIRRPWALCGLALLLGSASVLSAWHGTGQRWHRSLFQDRAGAQEISRRIAGYGPGVRVYCPRCGNRIGESYSDRASALIAGVDGGLSRPAKVELELAWRHLVPPFFVVSIQGRRVEWLRAQSGLSFEVLTPGAEAGADLQGWDFYSFYVPAEAAEESP